jgi:amino acid transporter
MTQKTSHPHASPPPPQDPAETSWDFPGWGTAETIKDLGTEQVRVTHLDSGIAHKLGVWRSTAICGNDITSSCLYVTAIAAFYAGPYAPIALALVAAVLYLYRNVYAEVGTALPLNGGAYNVLLNTTTKGQASLAACLTILSYIATAVLSADAAMHYASNLIPGLPIILATIGLLGLFALLNIFGISESSVVALGIFLFHILTLTVLCFAVLPTAWAHRDILAQNWSHPLPGGAARAVFFGFSAAMLGISGFESSANFIEEQKPGVFPKTLRNMWAIVAVFNPIISVLALSLLPLAAITASPEDLLAHMGLVGSGVWLQKWVSIDAVLVLSGAVLTSYVGVTGLVRRMSLDRCLPQVLLQENKWRHTNHWIILAFFGLCASILSVSRGDLLMLGGVYTIAFLSVMSLFAIGNILLKVKRGRLPRAIRASWPSVLLALAATSTALVGNILIKPAYVRVFLLYFLSAAAIVGLMFARVQILRLILAASETFLENLRDGNIHFSRWIMTQIKEINGREVIFFAEDDTLPMLNHAAIYVLENEQNKRLRIVHTYVRESDIPPDLAKNISLIDHIYPDLRIDLLLVKGEFGPQLIEHLSRRLNVPKNYMFIGTPSDRFPHSLASLGGVRLIM